MTFCIGRLEFITLLGGAAAAWPLAARAQQPTMPVIGFLHSASPDAYAPMVAAFREGLKETGYIEGQSVTIEFRWADGKYDQLPALAINLVDRKVTVIVVGGVPTAHWQPRRRPRPFPSSLQRPATRSGSALSPSELGSGASQFAVIQAVVPSLRVEVNPVNVGGAAEIERAVAAFARAPNGGLIATGGGRIRFHRDLIVKLAARHKLPAVYYDRVFVDSGGLISYGPDYVDQFRRAAGYVDHVLKGEKPADLPVQAPTKYETILNLKTAKALGLEIPPTLLAIADEVIE